VPSKAHDRENLGFGDRRPHLPPMSGKPLPSIAPTRATVVRAALTEAGLVAPEIEGLAANELAIDGKPRFAWTDAKPDALLYAQISLASTAERHRVSLCSQRRE
jgi:hypothetical protein